MGNNYRKKSAGYVPSGRRKKRRRRKRRNPLGLVVVFLCAVGVIAGVRIGLHRTIDKYDKNVIINGVSVGGIDVSGMTKQEAKETLQNSAEAYAQEKMTFVLENGNTGEATFAELGLSVKGLDKLVTQAAEYGKTGNSVSCYKILKQSEKGKLKKDFPLQYQITADSAKSILEARLNPLLNLPVNARVTQGENGVAVEAEQPGEKLDVEKTVDEVNQFLGKKWNGKGGQVEAKVSHVEPEVTAKDLEEMTDLLGSYSTYYGSDGSGRSMNVESGANHVGGTVLEAGEEISVNAAMEPYTEENGYYPAASYEGDMVVESMGGGICQVSTTLYNAVLLAELEVTERHPHSMQVTYVEPSMDAAIAEDILDFKFKNNYESAIYIESVLSEGTLTFNIYGKETRPANRTVEYVSETLETKEPEGKRFVATDDYIGYMGTQSAAHTGLSAQLWKVVYEDGEEVSRDVINYSQYLSSQETVAVGTASDNAEDVAKINAAIATQDESKIQAAIAEINGTSQ